MVSDISMNNFPYEFDEQQNLIIVDMNCNETVNFLHDVDYRLYMRYKWLIVNTAEGDAAGVDNKMNLTLFDDLPVLPSSEVYYYHNEEIVLIYRTEIDQPLIIEPFPAGNNSLTQRRQNLQQITFFASLVITNNDTLHHLDDYQYVHT